MSLALALLVGIASPTPEPPSKADRRKAFDQAAEICVAQLGGANRVSAEDKIAACTKVLESPRLSVKGRAIVMVNRSLGFAKLDATKQRAADLDAAIQTAPDLALGWSQSCSFHTWQIVDFKRAESECDKAIELAPGDPNGWTFRGDIRLVRREYGRAIADYDHAIRLTPKWMWPIDNRGEAYLRSGRIDRAIVDFERVIEVAPDYAMGYIDRGIARIKQGRLDDALADFEAGLKVSSDCDSCLYGRGVVASLKGDRAAAEAEIRAAKAKSANVSRNFDEDGVFPKLN